MPSQELFDKLTADLVNDCTVSFNSEENRELDDKEAGVMNRTAVLALKWTQTQPVSRFLDVPSEENESQTPKEKREARKARRKHTQQMIKEVKEYANENWEPDPGEEGVGFLISLISAVIFHLIVVLIVRWIVRSYFENPDVARQMCLPD